ncbi:uncharacterized protein LOC133285126 [Gastrolobium bilobum]|uniref:uncharacterized protein LOC133285126 n=1 Tax=Gastrolobium bilobum TaxID=150636 RepID=UPI002AB28687|nr:uncharacterized protein LOC133285126 [Gastrolobium bilobum]
MPLTQMKKLIIDEVKPTRMNVQLVDRSTKQAHGIVEDVFIKVNKFLIPVDFVILDIDEDASVPMIFEWPFLTTPRALIDVPKGELIMRVDGEQATFTVLTNEAPLPTSQPKDQVNYIVEKKVEEGNKKEVHQRHEESKPKVKMEKPKKVLEQMPPYAKFLKETLSKKLSEDEPVTLTEECNAIIQKNLPPKLKDPRSFSIPRGKTTIEKVLCDVGASINVMPLTLMNKLGIDEVKL